MGLQTVDDVVVGLQQHEVLSRVAVPHEDVAAVRAAHHKVVAPETRLFDLEDEKQDKQPQRRYMSDGSVQHSGTWYPPLINRRLTRRRIATAVGYHCPRVTVALVDHFDRRPPDVLGLALLHLPPFLPPAEQLLDAGRCGAPVNRNGEKAC